MNREGHKNVAFFIGPEVEHTPAYSKKTLFVVGTQDIARILELAREHKVSHIFMGANHSFEPGHGDAYWDKTITALLDRGYWVSLDYQAHQHSALLKILNKGIWQSRLFVPLLNVRIPHVQTSSPNLVVKIDDIDFKATNPGVWCMHFHEVTDSNRFTDWVEYGSDVVIEEEDDKPTPMPPYSVAPDPSQKVTVKNLKELKNVGQLGGGDAFLGSLAALQDNEKEALADPDVRAGFEMGLDTGEKTALKPELDAIAATVVTTPVDAAEAYAEGAKEDPLGKEGSKKGTKKK